MLILPDASEIGTADSVAAYERSELNTLYAALSGRRTNVAGVWLNRKTPAIIVRCNFSEYFPFYLLYFRFKLKK